MSLQISKATAGFTDLNLDILNHITSYLPCKDTLSLALSCKSIKEKLDTNLTTSPDSSILAKTRVTCQKSHKILQLLRLLIAPEVLTAHGITTQINIADLTPAHNIKLIGLFNSSINAPIATRFTGIPSDNIRAALTYAVEHNCIEVINALTPLNRNHEAFDNTSLFNSARLYFVGVIREASTRSHTEAFNILSTWDLFQQIAGDEAANFLEIAVRNRCTEIVTALIASDSFEHIPMISLLDTCEAAAENGYVEAINALLYSNRFVNKSRSWFGLFLCQALSKADENGHTETVNALVNYNHVADTPLKDIQRSLKNDNLSIASRIKIRRALETIIRNYN